MNCLTIFKVIFVAAMLATPVSAVSADDNATGVSKVSCPLYDISLPSHWICENPFDAAGMPPVRGALLLDAVGGETKCHLCYQSWKFFDINHIDDSQSCYIQSYILPSGDKPDIEFVKAMRDRQSEHRGSSKWIKVEQGYMKSSAVKNEGMKVTAKGFEKVVTHDREIEVLREGREYVHLLTISVPENRYKSDVKFRRIVDNVWKSWKLKK